MKVYLDQNVISDLYDGVVSIENNLDNHEWVYSHEHFKEIKRGNKTEYLELFDELNAKLILLEHDKSFQQTGKAYFVENSSPKDNYEEYLENDSDLSYDESIWTDLIVRMAGGKNKDSIANWDERLEREILGLVKEENVIHEYIKELLSALKPLLKDAFTEKLGSVDDLVTQRESLGTKHLSNLVNANNPIEEIWDLIKDNAIESTPEQYFGFTSMEGEPVPEYLGIIACHNRLNFLGFRPDSGLNKENEVNGILSDGSHIGYAAYCDQLISADKRFCDKAKAIYTFRNIGTTVTKI